MPIRLNEIFAFESQGIEPVVKSLSGKAQIGISSFNIPSIAGQLLSDQAFFYYGQLVVQSGWGILKRLLDRKLDLVSWLGLAGLGKAEDKLVGFILKLANISRPTII